MSFFVVLGLGWKRAIKQHDLVTFFLQKARDKNSACIQQIHHVYFFGFVSLQNQPSKNVDVNERALPKFINCRCCMVSSLAIQMFICFIIVLFLIFRIIDESRSKKSNDLDYIFCCCSYHKIAHKFVCI